MRFHVANGVKGLTLYSQWDMVNTVNASVSCDDVYEMNPVVLLRDKFACIITTEWQLY